MLRDWMAITPWLFDVDRMGIRMIIANVTELVLWYCLTCLKPGFERARVLR